MKGTSITDINDRQVTGEELEVVAGGYHGFYVCANCGDILPINSFEVP